MLDIEVFPPVVNLSACQNRQGEASANVKIPSKGVFELPLRELVENVATRCQEPLHLRLGLGDELDDQVVAKVSQHLTDMPQRYVVGDRQVMQHA